MTLAFTLCSLNYMHQAITLGNSFIIQNPDSKFIIGLVDVIDERVDSSLFSDFDVLPVSEVVNTEILSSMVSRYNIIELNTSVKPFYFKHFFSLGDFDKVIYLDPDIYVYSSFKTIEDKLDDNVSCVVTPHCVTPPDLKSSFNDHLYLRVGVFNLGFIALKNNAESIFFIEWWIQRLVSSCYISPYKGYFVDQLWANLSVCYFENILILKDLGCNMAIWNLHERRLIVDNGKQFVNTLDTPLIFFHFSGVIVDNYLITRHDQELNFENRPDLKQLIKTYQIELTNNNSKYFKSINCFYVRKNNIKKYFFTITNKVIGLVLKMQDLVAFAYEK